jgi:RimJ/RimL family protein N-acetyltransferase
MKNFNPQEKYTLEDEVVVLRPLETTDFEHLLPISLAEPQLWQYSLTSAAGKEGLKTYLAQAIAGRASAKEYPFVVFDKRTHQYAGSTRFYDIQLNHQCLQLGYTWYGTSFHGTGLNKHCKFLMLQFAFEQMDMERVEFRADNNNAKSIAAMKSIGCTVEGILRSNCQLPDGKRRDSIVLSILKSEWNNSVKLKLGNALKNFSHSNLSK